MDKPNLEDAVRMIIGAKVGSPISHLEDQKLVVEDGYPQRIIKTITGS